MNIVHSYLFFSIRFAGGTSDLMFKIAKAQEKQGLNPVIYSGDYQFDYDLAEKLPNTKFKITKSCFDAAGFSIMPNLKSEIESDKNNIDIIHMHVYRTFQNYIMYKFCLRNNIPYIMDAHGAVPYATKKVFLKKIYDWFIGRKILKNAAYLIAETEVGVKEYLDVDPSINMDKIKVISPPFDTDEFENIPQKNNFRNKYDINNEIKIVMFLGRVHHIKGNDFLIEAFADLCKSRDDCLLAIVGSDDGHMDECKKLARDFGIEDKVLFTGFIAGNDKNSALVDADIVVQMSRQEQGAWAPFEAVLCGTPIIVSEHTGAGEDVKRVKAGRTVPFGDVKSLSNCIEDIFNNYEDALDITKKARDFILNKMSMNARSHEYSDLYKKAIEIKKKNT